MNTKIKDYVPQPDEYTCQSACIAQILGTEDVYKIRQDLLSRGIPGDPWVMGSYLKERINFYKFLEAGSLEDAKKFLDEGCKVITHGWFTNSGHVINLVGHEPDPETLSYRFIVDDPWAEYSFSDGCYIENSSGNNVRYSSYGLYAYCITSSSYDHAVRIYRSRSLLSSEKGAWLHICRA